MASYSIYYIVIQWARVRLYRQSTSARCITVMYHSPNAVQRNNLMGEILANSLLSNIYKETFDECADFSILINQSREL